VVSHLATNYGELVTITAYLAAPGFEPQLEEELERAGRAVKHIHGRLLITNESPITASWAINTWFDAERIAITSIGDAAKALRSRQRNWACLAEDHRGRSGLITEKLPHVSAKPLEFGQPTFTAPLGSWTLLNPSTMLVANQCSSPFANGEATFVDDRTGPPNRAYKKLWEALALLRRFPVPTDRCLDLGASPGGWTWTLAQFGANVTAVDRAPLDPSVDALSNVTAMEGSAFGMDPKSFGRVEWMCSDVIGYPDRIVRLIETWQEHADTIICSIKFQGPTDHDAIAKLRTLPNAVVRHLFHNKHEVTFVQSAAGLGALAE
jgi:23S rRNA (cytidine2498-2'-O)-methyltransferase